MNLLLRTSWILFLAHLRRTLLSRRALVCLGLCSLPVVLSLMIAFAARVKGPPPTGAIVPIGWLLQVQTIVPLIALIVGSAVVAEEIEDRTITFLFTRPIPRSALLLGRWLASIVLLGVLLVPSTALIHSILSSVAAPGSEGATLPEGFARRLIAVALLGGAVYSSLFAALGVFVKHPILVGLAYTFVFEGVLANFPGSTQELSIQFYLKSFLLAGVPRGIPEVQQVLVHAELAAPGAALRTLALIGIAALTLGGWRLSRREYLLPS